MPPGAAGAASLGERGRPAERVLAAGRARGSVARASSALAREGVAAGSPATTTPSLPHQRSWI
eukprot:14887261-Alexandrium_andersonii.AAC.1